MIRAIVLVSIALTGYAKAQTAAEIDWVPRDKLSESRRQALLWFEEGAYVTPAPAQEAVAGTGPVTALADESEQVIDSYIDLKGNVLIQRGTNSIRAPRIRFDDASSLAEIEGPVVVRDTGLLLTGDSARINLFDETGTVTDASFLLHDVPLRGRAALLERLPDESMVLNNASLTRCEPLNNGWVMSTPRLKLDPVAGKGTARNLVIRVRNIPVLYAPYVSFPLDERRKTGILTPTAGYDSDGGVELVVPFYLNIAPQADATYEMQSIWRRGILHDGQFRFLLGNTENEINGGYLGGDELYDASGIVDETGAGTFEKQDRWYLSLSHDSNYEGRLSTFIDYNAVSDIDYLTDLEGRFGESTDRYSASVDTSAGDYRAPKLNRIGRIEWAGRHWQHRVEALAFQVLDPNGQPAYKKLPEFATTYRNRVGGLDVDVTAQVARFDKDTDGPQGLNEIVGDRQLVDASVSWRTSRPWGFLASSVGTVWRGYDLDDTPAGFDQTPTSTIPRFSLDAGLFFDRFFSLGGKSWQQTLEPRAYFLHVDSIDQDQYPVFDARSATPSFSTLFRWNRYTGYDRIGDARQLSLGLTSRLLSRSDGNEVLSASIGQIQYFEDRDVNYRLVQPGDDPSRERSPIFFNVRVQPLKGLRISGAYEFEPEVGRSNRGSFLMSYASPDYRRVLNFTYVFTNPDVQFLDQFSNEEESDLSIIWPVSRRWSAIGRWNFNWDERQTLESFAGIEYNDCCLKARVVFRRFLEYSRDVTFIRDAAGGPVTEIREIAPADTGIFFEFQFKGLATLGRRLDILLERAIPGYRQRETIIGQ